VWDLIDNFFLAFNISFIPREESTLADSLAVSASLFKIPLLPKIKYDVEIRYRPSVPDNIEHWKVFKDDLEIKKKFFSLSMNFLHCTLIRILTSKVTLTLRYF
jgi:hypothetical protein